LARFTGLPHRLELVATKQGVAYFDDSKGTNVGAVVQSLASFAGPVILLAGGVDKGGDYSPLRQLVQTKVRKLILFGAARDVIASALGNATDTLIVDTMAEAVRAAAAAACAGDTVLLSPACASFDQFRSYAHRGEVFRAAVEAL
jgi:UDP-N-acetylmuramoylalanine--D-glutamate ligase